jgi:hypothetical protein
MRASAENQEAEAFKASEFKTPFVDAMLEQNSDLRRHFYQSPVLGLADYTNRGLIVFVNGLLSNAQGVATNECPTVERILKRYSPRAIKAGQVRLIQMNAILQTSGDGDLELRKAVLATRVRAGDVVIVALID